jgi:hypothetical protein
VPESLRRRWKINATRLGKIYAAAAIPRQKELSAVVTGGGVYLGNAEACTAVDELGNAGIGNIPRISKESDRPVSHLRIHLAFSAAFV